MNNCHPLEVVGRGSKTQLQVGEILNDVTQRFRVNLIYSLYELYYILIKTFFFHLPTTSTHLHTLQVENCDSNSRFVVDEDDNGKFRLEMIKGFRSIDIFTSFSYSELLIMMSLCFLLF